MNFDNHDCRIKYYQLLLERDLNNIDHFPLPEGYRFVYYEEGDKEHWIEIEKSAKEFTSYEQGISAWDKFFSGKEELLSSRMIFIEDKQNRKVGTATAYYDITGRDKSGDGWLHWVSIHRDYQGKKLSKPLISHTLEIMKQLGYTHAKIPTQTTTWLAVKIYLDFGFRPIPKNAVNSRDGWRIIKTLTNHPALSEFDAASYDEITNETGV
ncbi:hypothetical protein M9Y10_031668 [Tritrichomonas musculus]|uniref:N-acetyltransferase domain-containing protein n=1 Tax=Tritrichomonas musculus TaxID=1915356 RepID=A0ABR2H174_9EUKA